MRRRRLVAGSVLTAALALVSLPGLAGSRAPRPIDPVPAALFQSIPGPANATRSAVSIAGLDAAHRSAGALDVDSRLIEPAGNDAGAVVTVGYDRPSVRQTSAAGSDRKPAKYTLHGQATFYDNGTTAMRLPRGTVVVICGAGGCIERTISDYGPEKPSRVVDMYRPDFFAICGCGWWSGVTTVTVYVY